jgi:hypothetical protein
MANYLLIRHNVRNFSEWKAGYDAHLTKRIDAGLTEKYLLQGERDPNEVVILFETQDVSRAKAFTESADLRERMQMLGVVGQPDIHFLTG